MNTDTEARLRDPLRELIRVAKSAGMNAASDFGYLPSERAADEEEISEAVQAVYAALASPRQDSRPSEGRPEPIRDERICGSCGQDLSHDCPSDWRRAEATS